MICIYHSRDLDGFTSGAIVKRRYPDAVLIGYDYGEELSMDKIPAGEPIIMVDVSMPMDKMLSLANRSHNKFTWIDHHASAIKDYEKFRETNDWFCHAVLQSGIAACELTWQYLFPNETMPIGVNILGEYDTWRNSDKDQWENIVMPFQYGMRLICNSPETFPDYLFDSRVFDIETIISKGDVILKYHAQIDVLLCRKAAFEHNIGGIRCICVNKGGASSTTFASVYDESKHDVMMPFFFNGTKWIFSLYSTKPEIDCSIIAKVRGGGGHKGAAGFEADDLNSVLFGFVKEIPVFYKSNPIDFIGPQFDMKIKE